MSKRPSGLEDPAVAAHAWARFRRIFGWTALAIVVIDAAAIGAIDYFYGPLSLLLVVSTAIGFALTMLLAAALMGLAFMSDGTGHDQAVDEFTTSKKDRDRS
jgi:hypothetical protein